MRDLWPIVLASDTPTLIYGASAAVSAVLSAVPRDRDPLDLRTMDLPRNLLGLRLSVVEHWRQHLHLVLRFDADLADDARVVLFEVAHRRLNVSPNAVRSFDRTCRVLAVCDAECPDAEVAGWFPLRIDAARLTPALGSAHGR